MSDRSGPPPVPPPVPPPAPPPVPPPGESPGFAPPAAPAPAPPAGKPRSVADVEAYTARALDDLVALTGRSSPGQTRELSALRDRLRGESRAAVVLVVGEAGRGKSALVNALLERPGLTPSGNDLQTSVHISFRYGPQPHARVLTPSGPRDVPLQAIASMVVTGSGPQGEEVLGAEIDLDAELLRDGIELVDTPGVGGLTAAHTRITLAALERADALVFVQDAGAELTAPELDFLAAAALRTRTVAVVLTKSEPYDESALGRIVALDRGKIAERVPALAEVPVLVVSSRLRLYELATAHRGAEISGFRALAEWLRSSVVARSNAVRVANLLHYLGQGCQTLEALQRVSAAAPTRSAQQLAEIEQRLEASVRDSGRWRTRLADEFADLSRLMREDIGREEMDLRFRYERDIQRWDERIRTQLGEEVLTDLRALAARANTMLERGALQIAQNLAAEFETPALIEVAQLAPGSEEFILAATRGLQSREPQKFDPMMALPATSTLFIGTRLPMLLGAVGVAATGAVGAVGAVLTPVGLALGGLGAVGLLRMRRRIGRQQEAREMAFKAIDRGAKELRTDVDNRLVVIQRAVRDELEAAFGRLLADLRKAVAQQREMAAADAKRREQLRKEAQARLLTLQRLRHRLRALSTVLAEITAEPAAGTPALAGPGVMLEQKPLAGPDDLAGGPAPAPGGGAP